MSTFTPWNRTFFSVNTTKRFVYWQILLFILQGAIILLPLFIFQDIRGFELFAFSGAYIFIALVSFIIASAFEVKGILLILPIFGILAILFGLALNLSYFGAFLFVLMWFFNALQGKRIDIFNTPYIIILLIIIIATITLSILYSPENVFRFETRVSCFTGSLIVFIVQFLFYLATFYELNPGTKSNMENVVKNKNLERLLNDLDAIDHSSFSLTLWSIANACPKVLKLEDFVIYMYLDQRKILIQMAAFGNKVPTGAEIVSEPIEIKPGHGIVGTCFTSQLPQLINDVNASEDYIVDDARRNSELAYPIIWDGKVVGVIDSENSSVGYFTAQHLEDFKMIANFCADQYHKFNPQSQG